MGPAHDYGMAKILFLVFVWGPALLGFSLGWLVAHPEDWTGPAVLIPLSAAFSGATLWWGWRRRPDPDDPLAVSWCAALGASLTLGAVLFGMVAFGILA